MLWAQPQDQMSEAEREEYEADISLISAENKKFARQMCLKASGLVILPFLAWVILAFADFSKPVSTPLDKLLVVLQLPAIALYLCSILAFPRYAVICLVFVLAWITLMLIVSNESNMDTVSLSNAVYH